MVFQEDFAVEQYMDQYETGIRYNLGETCCHSLSIEDISKLGNTGTKSLVDELISTRLIYGHIKGSKELKQGISKLYPESGLDTSNIVVTNGAIGANFLTFYGIVDKDDHVIVVDPSYQQLSSVPKMFGGNVDLLKLRFEDSYLPNLKELAEKVTKKTKLVVINNPHNPTGQVWSNEILKEIVDICSKNDCYLLCDEVYRPLYHTVTGIKSILNFGYEKVISTSSMSKAFSLAGLRLGWIATHDAALANNLHSKRDYNTISISMIDDLIATYALNNYEAILDRNHKLCDRNLKLIDKVIEDSNGELDWVRPKAGATCFIKVTNKNINTMEMCKDLAENYLVLTVPGEVFEHPGFIRVGFGNSYEELEGGFKIILKYLNDKKK